MLVKYKITILLFCAGLTLSQAATTNNTVKTETLFNKTLSDGSTVSLQRRRSVEIRTEQNTSKVGLPANAVVLYGRYITNHYTLILAKAGNEETVWETQHAYIEGMELHEGVGVVSSNLEQEVAHWNHVERTQVSGLLDVEAVGEKVYILFASKGHFRLQVQAKTSAGRWDRESSQPVGSGTSGKMIRCGDGFDILVNRADGTQEKFEETGTGR